VGRTGRGVSEDGRSTTVAWGQQAGPRKTNCGIATASMGMRPARTW
jgi:hypothetical protein